MTICSYKRMWLFSDIDNNKNKLTDIGKIIDKNVKVLYGLDGVEIHNYIIMPNHIHMLLELKNTNRNIPQLINTFKSSVSKSVGFNLWQKSYHDQIVRNYEEYKKIYTYIDENPKRWAEDYYFNM